MDAQTELSVTKINDLFSLTFSGKPPRPQKLRRCAKPRVCGPTRWRRGARRRRRSWRHGAVGRRQGADVSTRFAFENHGGPQGSQHCRGRRLHRQELDPAARSSCRRTMRPFCRRCAGGVSSEASLPGFKEFLEPPTIHGGAWSLAAAVFGGRERRLQRSGAAFLLILRQESCNK